jgi:mono/diheme cytochrome c family protein
MPIGYSPFLLDVEKADGLSNPREANLNSVWSGQRLYNAQCYTCHGKAGDGKGPVGPQMGVPDLHQDLYTAKTDGRFFAVITKGLRTMPRYGYKFSDNEKWDIVNYLRVLQGNKSVPGFSAPSPEQTSGAIK